MHPGTNEERYISFSKNGFDDEEEEEALSASINHD